MERICQLTLAEFMGEGSTIKKPPARIDPVEKLAALAAGCRDCSRCGLRAGCRQVVFGAGNPRARLFLIGEAPGADEDRLGRPFVGAAGRLLTRILEAVGLNREEVYITNVVKCRPPGNRLPEAVEKEACLPYLWEQLSLIDPPLIVCLGAVAARTLVGGASITRMRGRWHRLAERLVMPTFHPAALLRDPNKKRPVWEDFQQVAQYYRRLPEGDGP